LPYRKTELLYPLTLWNSSRVFFTIIVKDLKNSGESK